jgi:hypothetical protein
MVRFSSGSPAACSYGASAANPDHGDTARELGGSLLQLLLVVVGRRLLDLRFNLRDPGFDFRFLAGTADDGYVFLLDQRRSCYFNIDRDNSGATLDLLLTT